MNLPKEVSLILSRLRENGYLAFVVGGAVRDFLLGKNPTDYDVATSALPEDIKRIFSNYHQIDSGMKHGTVMVIINKKMYEITTFRKETNYIDHRHPSKVTFIDNLYEDLSRRDFTINAMAYYDKVYDYFGGKEDIKNHLIRTVNNPLERFDEDALRILRAIRFSACLDYDIEPNTKKAIFEKMDDLKYISKERILQELSKMFMGNVLKLESFYPVFKKIFPNLNEENYKENLYLMNKASNFHLRMAIFLKDSKDIFSILKDLKFPNSEIREINFILEEKKFNLENNEYSIKKLLNKYIFDTVSNIIKFHNIVYGVVIDKDIINNALNSCYSIKDLDIDGNDLIPLDIPPQNRNIVLNMVLEEVMKDNLENKKEILLKYIKEKTQ